jgi:hypothetical protein
MQTKIMLTLTVLSSHERLLPLLEATVSATTATHPLLSTAYRRLTTARMRSGSTAKARGSYKEALKRSDRLALVSERLRPGTADAPYPHPAASST